MSWYVIAWRDSSPRSVSAEVPGLRQWYIDNFDAIRAANRQIKLLLPPKTEQCAAVGLGELFKSWNAGFTCDGDGIEMPCPDYFGIVDILPEHKAPVMRCWGDGEMSWYTVDEETGEKSVRHVCSVTTCPDIIEAMREADKEVKANDERVDEYDTEEWKSHTRQLRRYYDAWSDWMEQQVKVRPPAAIVEDFEEAEDDAKQG